jgi:protein gp37
MSKKPISWNDTSWNPWEGCNKVSPGCKHCYMYTMLRAWGRDPAVVRRTKTTWRQPYTWERKAVAAGQPKRLFTCSLSDWFHPNADPWRDEAWRVITGCPHVVFQILTKRPERIADHLPADWGEGYPNVWLGVSVENNDYLGRVDTLRKIPARLRFISAEPLLGPLTDLDLTGIHWLIAGGESGPGFRPMNLDWARELRDRAVAERVAFFYRQEAGRIQGTNSQLDGVEWRQLPVLALFPRECGQVVGQRCEEDYHRNRIRS